MYENNGSVFTLHELTWKLKIIIWLPLLTRDYIVLTYYSYNKNKYYS